jgi:Barstar (barnase inhibitor)
MSVFGQDDDNTLDYQVLRDGSVSLYRNLLILEEDLQWFRQRRYRIYRMDCTTWTSEAALHESLQTTFMFPAYYGKNRNALWDSMSDLDIPDDGGVTIVLSSYDVYANGAGAAPSPSGTTAAEALLDIFATTSRSMLLIGKRLITLVQSSDPSIRFGKLGGNEPSWNRREWLDKDRGL